jgi:hypothetical protein
MYVIETVKDPEQIRVKATKNGPFGPGFAADAAAKADTLVVRGTSFTDPGPDYVEFELLADGRSLGVRRVEGY